MPSKIQCAFARNNNEFNDAFNNQERDEYMSPIKVLPNVNNKIKFYGIFLYQPFDQSVSKSSLVGAVIKF